MIIGIPIGIAALMVIPYLVSFERWEPRIAAMMWFAQLLLRAFAAVYLAACLALFLPRLPPFSYLGDWCWHPVVPVVEVPVGIGGHQLGHATGALILAAIIVSGLSALFFLARANRKLQRTISANTVGAGPRDTLIVGGQDMLIGVAGMRHPRVVVSAGTLAGLDDDELRAAIDHEYGHVSRRHRFVFVVAEFCRGFARFIPGARRADQELRFHLERDADRWALARRNDPAVLASAICKAALTRGQGTPVLSALTGGNVTRRVRELLSDLPAEPQVARHQRGFALVLSTTTALGVLAIPCITALTFESDLNQGLLHSLLSMLAC